MHATLPVAALLLAAGAAHAQFTVNTNGEARYQGAPLQSGSMTVVNPPLVLGDVANVSLTSNPSGNSFSYARSNTTFGFDALGGYSRNFARASGFNPGFGPPNEVFANSNTSAAIAYRVSSPSTPVGTPIQVRCFLAFTGELGVANYYGDTLPGEHIATFGASLTIDNVPFFDATASLEQRFSNSVSGPFFNSTGPWGGSWTSSVETELPLGDYYAMTLSHLDVVNFNTVMAADFDVVFSQYATAHIPGPLEAICHADFSNTGRLSFQAFDLAGQRITDAEFNILPAPASSVVLGFVLASGLRRRR